MTCRDSPTWTHFQSVQTLETRLPKVPPLTSSLGAGGGLLLWRGCFIRNHQPSLRGLINKVILKINHVFRKDEKVWKAIEKLIVVSETRGMSYGWWAKYQ